MSGKRLEKKSDGQVMVEAMSEAKVVADSGQQWEKQRVCLIEARSNEALGNKPKGS